MDIDGSNNTVGGTEAAARNIISGNVLGVAIFLSGATGNQVTGNYIGTDKDGDQAVGNSLGVSINGASNNTVGERKPGRATSSPATHPLRHSEPTATASTSHPPFPQATR